MPTYDYVCTACGHSFERFQKFSDEPVKVCPECGGVVRRVIHSAGIIFKGSGWYITDHGRAGSKAQPGESGEKAESGTKEPAKAESAASSSTSTPDSAAASPASTPSPPAKSGD